VKFQNVKNQASINVLEKKDEEKEKEAYFPKLVAAFTVGSFLGWLWETILSYFQFGEFYSRVGVLYGPLNPIYGFGLILMILVLKPMKRWYAQLFVGSIAGGGFEYTVWALSMKVLKKATWNYQSPFVITIGETEYTLFKWAYWGGTSLFHSFFWGLVGLVSIKFIYPTISKAVDSIPSDFRNYINTIVTVLLSIDIFLTCVALLRQMSRDTCSNSGQYCLESNYITNWLDSHYPDSRLNAIFQNLKKYD